MPTTTTTTTSIPVASTIQNRQFGVELEIYGLNRHRAAEVLREAGINCYPEDYNHLLRTHWKTVTDGSIMNMRGEYDRDNSCEVVSPILVGEDGLEQVRKVCKALSAAGAKVNKSTGFHVHVNARDLSGREIATTIKRYAKHEATIDSLMPVSRRASNNHLLKSIVSLVENYGSRLDAARTGSEVVSAVRGPYGGENRYLKLNVESYLRHGTIEFRHHSGSINAEKCVNWVRFCVNFVEVSRTYAANTGDATPARRGRRPGRRPGNNAAPARVLAYLRDGQFHRPYDIARECGIAEASVPAIISGLRRQGCVIRNRRYSGYWLVGNPVSLHNNQAPAARTTAACVTVPDTDSCFLGLPESIIGYYQERIADLAA